MEPVVGSVSFFRGGRLLSRLRFAAVVAAAPILLATSERAPARTPPAEALQPTVKRRVPFRILSENELTDTAYRASALRGRAILLATRDSLTHNLCYLLRCGVCHLDGVLRLDGS